MQHLKEIQGYQTPLALVRLRYIEEWNLPHAVELYQQNKLKDYLNKEVDRVEWIIGQLMKEGRNRHLAEEEVIGNVLAPPRDENPPKWSKKLLELIPEIERSLKIDYSDQESSAEISDFDETKESQVPKYSAGSKRDSLPKRKRIHSLNKHLEAITNNFKRLAELARERELRLKGLGEKMDKEGIPLEERSARFQQIYHEMVEVPDFDPYHVDKLELWKLRNEDLLKSKVDAIIAAKITSKGLTYLEAMRDLQKELDEILKAEQEAKEKTAIITQADSLQRDTPQTKTLLEIATEKLRSLQHYPADKNEPILSQLINHLVFSQESAGEGTEFELTVLALKNLSDKALQHYLFGDDPEMEQEKWISTLLEKAVTKDEIYEVMIDELLMNAMTQWEEPEPD